MKETNSALSKINDVYRERRTFKKVFSKIDMNINMCKSEQQNYEGLSRISNNGFKTKDNSPLKMSAFKKLNF